MFIKLTNQERRAHLPSTPTHRHNRRIGIILIKNMPFIDAYTFSFCIFAKNAKREAYLSRQGEIACFT